MRKILSLFLMLLMFLSITPQIAFAKSIELDLYFAQNPNNTVQKWLCTTYTDTTFEAFYTNFGINWTVSWDVAFALPKLTLGTKTSFENESCTLHIDQDSIVELLGDNTINNLYINSNVKFKGEGSLTVNNLYVNSKFILDGPTINAKDMVFNNDSYITPVSGKITVDGDEAYSSNTDTVYLAKKGNNCYSLFADEDFHFEYISGINTEWKVSDDTYQENHYVTLNLIGDLNKNIIFEQDENNEYISVLRINGSETDLGGFDASGNILTVQSSIGNKVTVNGNIKADKLYMSECQNLDFTVVDGKIEITSDAMIGSYDKQMNLNLKNGGIDFSDGTIYFINSEVNISKNDLGTATDSGIFAHSVILDNAILNIEDVNTGIKLLDVIPFDADGAKVALYNGSSVTINAKDIGVLGTSAFGGGYYNNILVDDEESIFTIKGKNKAVENVAINPVPNSKYVRTEDEKPVLFKINSDENLTSDYYLNDGVTVATSLELAYANIKISKTEHGEIAVSNQGATTGIVTIITKPDSGYYLSKLVVKDSNGVVITTGNTINMDKVENMPVTVSAVFEKTVETASAPVAAPAEKTIPTIFVGENKGEIKVLTLSNTYMNEDNTFSAVAPIIIEENRTFLGIRDIAEVLRIPQEAVKWDDKTKTASITKSGAIIEVTQGSKMIKMTYMGYIYTILNDVSAINRNDRIYLPFRVIFELFGYSVNWDNETRTITCK